MELLARGTEVVSLFCRLNVNNKKNLPIRSSEMGLLILLSKSDVPITPVMAAEFFKVKKPMITTMVNSLTKQGYIEKIPSETDKRSFTMQSTNQAVELVNETYQEYFNLMSLLKNKMGDEFETMINLLEKANEILLEDKNYG